MVHEQAAEAPAKAVGQWNGLDDETVKQIDREHLEQKIALAPKGNATFLGVDEVAHQKGHHYLTVVTDLVARRAIALEEGRSEQSLGKFLRYLGPEHCAAIQAVSVDRWKPYHKALRKHCPQALIVFDKFHVIQDCNEAVDRVRKNLQGQLSKEERIGMKHSRWALLKRPETLTQAQRETLKQIERHNRPLYRAYLLKEQFRQFYAMKPREGQDRPAFLKEVQQIFAAWATRVMRSRIVPLKKFVRQLRKQQQMVLNYFIHRLSNGLSEALNGVIKRIQRRACGYRDMAYFTLKIYQKAGVIR